MHNRRDENSTRLIFCNPKVQPGVVTSLLDLKPSSSYGVGDSFDGRISEVGFWAMTLPKADPTDSVEIQIGQWLELLRTKADAFLALREGGYGPYLDCKAESRSLSLCIDPKMLAELGALHISLSIWLYEQGAR